MKRICLFPGTFDPITKGHVDIVQRAVGLFDKLVIGVGINSGKAPMFSDELRVKWIKETFATENRIEVVAYEGLTVDFARKLKAKFIIRGIRYVSDFEYEKAIADMNRMLSGDIETIFLTCTPKYSSISSTLVRDVIRNRGDVSNFIPKNVQDALI